MISDISQHQPPERLHWWETAILLLVVFALGYFWWQVFRWMV